MIVYHNIIKKFNAIYYIYHNIIIIYLLLFISNHHNFSLLRKVNSHKLKDERCVNNKF